MSFFGDLIASTGRQLRLPELGISEKFGSTGANTMLPTPQATVTNNIAGKIADTVRPGSAQPVGSGMGQRVTDNFTAPTAGGGGGGAAADPVAVAAAANNAKKQRLKGEGISTLDQLYALYDELVGEIQRVGGDQTNRINKDFDGKIADQVTDMNNGMYDVDVASAAGNLADSSWRSFDRGKVRTAADANVKTLNNARESGLAEVGSMVANDTAKYRADQQGIGRSKQLLSESDDLNEIQSTANTVDATRRGVAADKSKYSTTGEFAQKAGKVGNYDTSVLEQTLASVVSNATASPATKAATINDLLTGTPLGDTEKERLKNKYTQNV